MVGALRAKKIDATYRGLAASDVVGLQGKQAKDGIQLVEGAGMEISYLVFNPKDPWAAQAAVRKAVAQVVDRGAIAHKIYQDTVEPLYSMVPRGSVRAHRRLLRRLRRPERGQGQGRSSPGRASPTRVPLTLWYTTDRYGSATGAEFTELKRQLNGPDCSTSPSRVAPGRSSRPDTARASTPSSDAAGSPTSRTRTTSSRPSSAGRTHWERPTTSKEITDDLLPQSRRESDRAAVVGQFKRAQKILVDDARLLPLWQGKQYIAASEEISGGERALDPSSIMMMWELQRKTSW